VEAFALDVDKHRCSDYIGIHRYKDFIGAAEAFVNFRDDPETFEDALSSINNEVS